MRLLVGRHVFRGKAFDPNNNQFFGHNCNVIVTDTRLNSFISNMALFIYSNVKFQTKTCQTKARSELSVRRLADNVHAIKEVNQGAAKVANNGNIFRASL